MVNRRRTTPWIHRWSRYIILAITVIGAIGTTYLTLTKLGGGEVACFAGSGESTCDQVLSSPYATVFGLPLSLFGALAYISMGLMAIAPLPINRETNKQLRLQVEQWTWLYLFVGGTAMAVFSSYLMYVLAFKLKVLCLYCVGSALFSASLFVVSSLGHEWEDKGQLIFTGVIVAMITLIGTLGIYAGVNNPTLANGQNSGPGQEPPAITTRSGPAEIELARHLKQIDARMFSAYWCPHCYDQRQLFGKEAFQEVPYVECDPNGKNPQPDLCQSVGVEAYPTWQIKGELHQGTQPLRDLAQFSGYTGPQNFQN